MWLPCALCLLMVAYVALGDAHRHHRSPNWPTDNSNCSPCLCQKLGYKKAALCADKQLEAIPTHLPDDLTLLDLDYNNITLLDFDTISNFRYLDSLSMKHNPLLTLQMNIFQNLTRLQYLDLTGCNLTDVPPGIFNNTKLKLIKGLYVNSAPNDLLQGLDRLRDLQLTTDDELFEPNIFRDTGNIHTIDLTLTRARRLPRELFSRQSTSIWTITICGPQLTHLDPHIFRTLINIKKVRLILKDMETLPAVIFNAKVNREVRSLREIWISGVHYLPVGIFSELDYLHNLTIHNLRDPLFSNFTHGIRQLSFLELSGNNITHVNATWFEHSELLPLKTLNLSNNHLTNIQLELRALDQIQNFNLSRNRIHSINPRAFYTFRTDVINLDLSHNRLRHIPTTLFMDMYNLRSLWLNNNFLNGMDPSLFYDISALQILCIQYNEIDSLIYDNFTEFYDLLHLNLSHNNISHLGDDTFQELGALKVLDLSNNFIIALPDELLSNTFLEYVNLDNNPLLCDCHILQLFDVHFRLEATCAAPEDYAGRHVNDLESTAVCPWDYLVTDMSTSLTPSDQATNTKEMRDRFSSSTEDTMTGNTMESIRVHTVTEASNFQRTMGSTRHRSTHDRTRGISRISTQTDNEKKSSAPLGKNDADKPEDLEDFVTISKTSTVRDDTGHLTTTDGFESQSTGRCSFLPAIPHQSTVADTTVHTLPTTKDDLTTSKAPSSAADMKDVTTRVSPMHPSVRAASIVIKASDNWIQIVIIGVGSLMILTLLMGTVWYARRHAMCRWGPFEGRAYITKTGRVYNVM